MEVPGGGNVTLRGAAMAAFILSAWLVVSCSVDPAIPRPTPRPTFSTLTLPVEETPDAVSTWSLENLGSMEGVVVRAVAGHESGPFHNEDAAIRRGTYEFQVRCSGGPITAIVNGVRLRPVSCAPDWEPGARFCLGASGLSLDIERVAPYGDLAWQIRGVSAGCIDQGTATN